MDSDQPNAPNNRTAQREGRTAAKCFVETTEPLVQVRLFRKNRKQAARAKLKQLQSKKPAANSNQCSSQYVQSKVNRVGCLLYTSPSPRDATLSRMPSSA